MTEQTEQTEEQSAQTNDEAQDVPEHSKAVTERSARTEDEERQANRHTQEPNRDVYESRGFKKLIATFLTLITLASCGALIALVVAGFIRGLGSGEWDGSLTAVLITVVGVLITGIFVFMAFRIDRGARAEARQVAEEVSAVTAADARERAIYAAKRRAEETARKGFQNMVEAFLQGSRER